MRGKYITLEGGEGCGKSTQVKLLAQYLEQKGISCVLSKEPGSTVEGQVIRNLLVTGDKDKFDAVSECLLYYADRRCDLTKVVWPALDAGKWVVSDRYADSTEAYQYYGYNKRVPKKILEDLYNITVGDFYPDLTLILDIDPQIGLSRSMVKNSHYEEQEIRFESRKLDFHNNLRNGFLEIAKTANRYVVLNAEQSVHDLHSDIVKVVDERLINV